ncbi:MAG: NapC/NirT family cytochrome c [Chloroflexi bacterium]|nr:NapC/NirT family cytochrome c [Chloroflexota bacterium]
MDRHHPRHREKLLFLMFAGAIGLVLLVISGFQLMEFTDSTAFCGRLCHGVMYPEYTVYQASPHSRVTCSECHVGPGASYMVKSKVSGMPMVVALATNKFHRPIPTPVENLRPAPETCEKCHRPERFAGDLVRVHTTFATDENNTRKVDTRVLRVGGGESEVARDIHWHIAASVWYLAMDQKRQDIAWVGVQQSDGTLVEFIDPRKAEQVTPERIAKEKRLMDCVDCHNRATHIFDSPSNLIDSALTQGEIDAGLPFIKKVGVEALDPVNSSLEAANAKVEAIRDFYRANYPELAQQKSTEIDRAIAALKGVATLTTFPDMHVDWNTYKSNLGHLDPQAPGCFRCHGKLEVKGQKGKFIDAGCTSCHYTVKIQE